MPGQKLTARRREMIARRRPTAAPSETSRARTSGRDFTVFCIKRILSSGNLVYKDGNRWMLHTPIAGVETGEEFPSLDACAKEILSSLEYQSRGKAA